MDALRLMTTRRNVVRGIAATAASFAFPSPSRAQSVARIVVIGGGFGGAAVSMPSSFRSRRISAAVLRGLRQSLVVSGTEYIRVP